MKEFQEQAYLAQLAELQSRHWPAGTPREPTYPHGELTIAEYLRKWAGLQPDKAAVIFYGKEISYAELDRLSDRCAALLHSHGVRQGDRVAAVRHVRPGSRPGRRIDAGEDGSAHLSGGSCPQRVANLVHSVREQACPLSLTCVSAGRTGGEHAFG